MTTQLHHVYHADLWVSCLLSLICGTCKLRTAVWDVSVLYRCHPIPQFQQDSLQLIACTEHTEMEISPIAIVSCKLPSGIRTKNRSFRWCQKWCITPMVAESRIVSTTHRSVLSSDSNRPIPGRVCNVWRRVTLPPADNRSGSKAHLQEKFRVTIRILIVDSWEHLMDLRLNEDNYEVTTIKRILRGTM